MSEDRRRRIDEARQKQPIEELRRKARKARERANLWSQEELDLAKARARSFMRFIRGASAP